MVIVVSLHCRFLFIYPVVDSLGFFKTMISLVLEKSYPLSHQMLLLPFSCSLISSVSFETPVKYILYFLIYSSHISTSLIHLWSFVSLCWILYGGFQWCAGELVLQGKIKPWLVAFVDFCSINMEVSDNQHDFTDAGLERLACNWLSQAGSGQVLHIFRLLSYLCIY